MMLKEFRVKGFKSFKNEVIFNFSNVKSYSFNEHCIKNSIVSKAILYGKCGSGKSNLGLAIFDIVKNLSDRQLISQERYSNYLNADSVTGEAEFTYIFDFNGSQIIYKYKKTNYDKFKCEQVEINGEIIIEYSHQRKKFQTFVIPEAKQLNFEGLPNDISILKYIINNSNFGENHPLRSLRHFVGEMLYLKVSDEVDCKYIDGAMSSEGFVFGSFKNFMKDLGFVNKYCIDNINGKSKIMIEYNDKKIPYFEVASCGEKGLIRLFSALLTTRLKEKNKEGIQFLFVDELDVFYDFKISKKIVEIINENGNFQSVLTTHNTNLISNKLMRPDCYLIINDEKIINLSNVTQKDLREGHNLEKMYLGGEFSVK